MSVLGEKNWSMAVERQLFGNNNHAREQPFLPGLKPFEEGDIETLSAADLSLMKKILRNRELQAEPDEKIEVVRSNNENPLLRSVKTFKQLLLPPALLEGVYAMGFDAPSHIQEITLPTLLADPPTNMIAQAQSGTGKTAAFVLASLNRVRLDHNYPQVLILAPTYELALQIGEATVKMAEFSEGIRIRLAVRGEELPKGHILTDHVLIGTPGKVFEWSRRRGYFDLLKIKMFVLDEADVMISTQGHQDQCLRLHKLLSSKCQALLFSATYTNEVMTFAEMIIQDPIIIRLKREEETLENVGQFFVKCASDLEKYEALQNVYGILSIGQAMLFCRTRQMASWLGERMTKDGHSVGYLSGELSIQARVKAITRFKEGKEKVLITTNVCARGIDVEQVTVVVNFDLPVTMRGQPDCETYLHRIGRSGRFGRRGVALNLVATERDLKILQVIQQHFGTEIKLLDVHDVDQLEQLNV